MAFIRKNLMTYFLLSALLLTSVLLLQRWAEIRTAPVDAAAEVLPYTVIVDAGHGGEDGGACSCTGALESELNLEIALRVNDLLHLLGRPTRMVRSTDVAVYSEGCTTIAQKKASDLKNRVKLVNETPNALLVSIHQNQFSESKYYGAQVFYAAHGDSRALAEQTQALLNTQVDTSNHRTATQTEAVYLLRSINCTGILVECGFLSNAAEEARLHEAKYQKKLAAAICGSVNCYLSEKTGEEHEA